MPEPFTLVIFGASGDLTRRKLVPAVYRLFQQGLLPQKFSVVGFARSEKTDAGFRAELRDALGSSGLADVDGETWGRFERCVHYHRAEYDDAAGFRSLQQRLNQMAEQRKAPCHRLFYLATPPSAWVAISNHLLRSGLSRCDDERGAWSRIVVEKPLGRDLTTAQELTQVLRSAFEEEQIFRIDHYLGKETVQNILVLRFANSIFEPLWNQKYVDHVQITVSETIGVQGRGPYYEQAGALRDIVQNHMMHLLCLVAMEPPVSLDANAIRDEKVKVLRALTPLSGASLAHSVVRGQYTAGRAGRKEVAGYRQEEHVAPYSTTETFVAMKLFIDNWRWATVPFYLRTGKRMTARVTEISIHFKEVPRILFGALPTGAMEPNVLAIRIQPHEGISLRFQVKVPGPAMQIRPLEMDFSYADSFGREPPDAYERLLLDAALGDQSLFTRSDEVEAAWTFLGPILDAWAHEPAADVPGYAAGTWGPKEADDLIGADGRRWEILRPPGSSRHTQELLQG